MRHLVIILLFFWGSAALADDSSLIITYQVAPAERPWFRQQLTDIALPRFAALREKGVLKSYRVLASRYVDAGNWDFMTILSFAGSAELERWKDIERDDPSGLPTTLLAKVSSVISTPADLIRSQGNPSRSSVFLVISYQYLVSVGEYKSYLDGYTLPQFNGWIGEKTLADYAVYLSRYPAGRPWNALLMLDYQDETALADRDRVVALVRSRLKENPDWKSWSENKKAIRDERQAVVADELRPGNR